MDLFSFSQRGDGQGSFISVPFYSFEDVLRVLKSIYPGSPVVALAVPHNTFEDLFSIFYDLRGGIWVSNGPVEHLDCFGAVIIPPTMSTGPSICMFDGSLHCSRDGLGDACCKLVQLKGGRLWRKGSYFFVH